MKVLLDGIIFSLQECGGISGMFARLAEELQHIPGVEVHLLERTDATRNIFRKKANFENVHIHYLPSRPILAERYLDVVPPSALTSHGQPFIFHSSYYRHCNHPLARRVCTVHDFTYEVMRLRSPLATLVHSAQKNRAIRHSQAVACVSLSTLSDLHRLLGPHSGQPRIMIPNAPLCTPVNSPKEISSKALTSNDILFVGARAHHKNFPLVVKALENSAWHLYLCSHALEADEIRLLKKHLRPGQWSITVYPNGEDLSKAYSNARCLIYPSSYEGFGIPIVEAQAHGLPVIIGPCAASREAAGEGAIILEDYSPESLRRAIDSLSDSQTATRLAAAGLSNAAKYSWHSIAMQYYQLYSKVLMPDHL